MAIDGVTDTGWSVKGGVGKDHAAVFELAEELGDGGGDPAASSRCTRNTSTR